MYIVGIDPGLTGAIACIVYKPFKFCWLADLPTMRRGSKTKQQINPYELKTLFTQNTLTEHNCLIFLEIANAMPGQGVSSMVTIGHTLGIIEGVIGCLGLRYELVHPAKWKRQCQLTKDKEKSRMMAIRKFPSAAHLLARKGDHNRAEALLLASWGRSQPTAGE